jgi:saccharopine dehydrogenase-like NADP-dependent oxidoreductase
MNKILILGAGRSATTLIKYLAERSTQLNVQITIADNNPQEVQKKTKDFENVKVLALNANQADERSTLISGHNLIISMLPAFMHVEVAKDCIKHKKNLITPSYISPEMKSLQSEIEQAGLLFLNEMGVDPGIDHMSAMKIIHTLKAQGATIHSFESYCGGLIAPESDDNPWGYKFTWNPRNVVLAGQGGAARFIRNGQYKYVPYHKLFERIETISIPGYGVYDGYANRDSLSYIDAYGLNGIPNILRGTLRKNGFCKAWNIFVQLGCTDNSYFMDNVKNMTWRSYLNSFLDYHPTKSVEEKLCTYLNIDKNSDEFTMLAWLEIFDDKKIGIEHGTPADILQHLLEQKWKLLPEDKDMIVMFHRFKYLLNGNEKQLHSSMIYKGKNQVYTAMSDTVGLPLAIAAKLILQNKIQDKGLLMPLQENIYKPVLSELEEFGIRFNEYEVV